MSGGSVQSLVQPGFGLIGELLQFEHGHRILECRAFDAIPRGRRLLGHGNEWNGDTVANRPVDARAGLVAARGIQTHTWQRRHQLEAPEAMRHRGLFAALEQQRAEAAPRKIRVNEEGADLRGIGGRIEFGGIAIGCAHRCQTACVAGSIRRSPPAGRRLR